MSFTVKAYLESSGRVVETRRFALEQSAASSYGYLVQKLSHIFLSLHGKTFTTYWKDPEGDRVALSSDEELVEALSYNGDLFRVFLQVDGTTDTRKTSECSGSGGYRPSAEESVHAGIMCDGCGGAVTGVRYKCVVCPDYDLCSCCERKFLHTEHEMLRIAMPRTRRPTRGPCAFRSCGRGGSRPSWAPWCGLLSGGAPPAGESQRSDAADFLQHVGEQLSELLEPLGVSVRVQHRSPAASGAASAASGAPPEPDAAAGCCGRRGAEVGQAGASSSPADAAAAATGAPGTGLSGEDASSDARLRGAVEAMRAMGFHDDDGWLSAMLRTNECDVQRAVAEVLRRNAGLYP